MVGKERPLSNDKDRNKKPGTRIRTKPGTMAEEPERVIEIQLPASSHSVSDNDNCSHTSLFVMKAGKTSNVQLVLSMTMMKLCNNAVLIPIPIPTSIPISISIHSPIPSSILTFRSMAVGTKIQNPQTT
jgi:hypothetical protein